MTIRNALRLSVPGALALFVSVGPAIGDNDHDATRIPIQGSIKVEGKHSRAELKKMAKISLPQAEKTALAAVAGKDSDKTVVESELEVEDGFLVYAVEVRVKGQKGAEEILVDAGSGKVLGREAESEDDDDDDDDDDEPGDVEDDDTP